LDFEVRNKKTAGPLVRGSGGMLLHRLHATRRTLVAWRYSPRPESQGSMFMSGVVCSAVSVSTQAGNGATSDSL